MKKIYDLVVKVGSYEKNGETKGRYINVGSVMESDDNKFILLHRTFNPAGVPNPENKDSIILSMFKIRDKNEKPSSNTQGGGSPFFDDDIPF